MILTIAERSVLLDGWRWLLGGVPSGLRRLAEGKLISVRLPGPQPKVRGQRVRLLLEPELVLSRRLRLPVTARGELASAIRLLIETETPFGADELIVHAERLVSGSDAREAAYQVRMVPRAALLSAAAEHGVRSGQIVAIAAVEAPDRTDFWRAAFPIRAALRWAIVGPILVGVTCGVLLLAEARLNRETQLAILAGGVSDRLTQLRETTAELKVRRDERLGSAELASILSASSSAFNMLGKVRTNLPADVQVARLEFSGQTIRLSVRARDALAVARYLGGTLSAQIDGAITIDPPSGLEQATIRIQHIPGGER